MKTNRFKLVGVIVLVAIMGFAFVACSKTNPESDFEAKAIDGGKGVEITKYIGDKQEISIPSKIRGLPVTTIGFKSFYEKQLTKITIPNSVKVINMLAFAHNQLTKITIPNSVIEIGDSAFAYNQLTKITIPNSVIEIDHSAFAQNQLTKITIPNSVTVLRGFADNQLAKITIPNSVTTISGSTFAKNQLTSVTIPNGVTWIGDRAFRDNPLTSITIGANFIGFSGAGSFEGEKCLFFSAFGNNDFYKAYNSNSKAAGTYTRPNAESTAWTKQ